MVFELIPNHEVSHGEIWGEAFQAERSVQKPSCQPMTWLTEGTAVTSPVWLGDGELRRASLEDTREVARALMPWGLPEPIDKCFLAGMAAMGG